MGKETNPKQIAEKAFSADENLQTVHVTEDGQAFTNKNRAQMHATRNATGKPLTLKTFHRADSNVDSDSDGDAGVLDNNANDAIAAVGKLTSLEELNALADKEAKGKNRSTVLAAINKQLDALNTTE